MMNIIVNGKETRTTCRTVLELRDEMFPDFDIVVLNGYGVSDDAEMNTGDCVHFGIKGHFPNEEELEMLMSSRNSPRVHEILKRSTIGIAGLGGLGSNIASMLARSGIGHLVVADFDTVDPTNLNRQNYFIKDLGSKKTDATERIVSEINPFVKMTKFCGKVDETNSKRIFGCCDIVCEAFDSPSEKAMLINTLSEECPDMILISGSGMAGYEDSNLIRTEKKFRNLYICGDAVNDAKACMGLMAPRVNICAGHMSNTVLRILMGEKV